MEFTEHERQCLNDTENAAVLRDLYHSRGWELYTRFARERIETMLKEYLRKELSREEIIDQHTKLQAVTEFQAGMEDLVRGAVNFLTPENLESMILLSRIEPDV